MTVVAEDESGAMHQMVMLSAQMIRNFESLTQGFFSQVKIADKDELHVHPRVRALMEGCRDKVSPAIFVALPDCVMCSLQSTARCCLFCCVDCSACIIIIPSAQMLHRAHGSLSASIGKKVRSCAPNAADLECSRWEEVLRTASMCGKHSTCSTRGCGTASRHRAFWASLC